MPLQHAVKMLSEIEVAHPSAVAAREALSDGLEMQVSQSGPDPVSASSKG